MLQIMVVEDHPIVREGLKRIISESRLMAVTAEAAAGNEALELIKSKPCDAVVLDLNLPDRNGIDVLREMRASSPNVPILVLSVHPEDQYAVRSLRAGASGYLNKEVAPAMLVEAIKKIARGGRYVSPGVAEKLASNSGNEGSKQLHELLSDREYQILRLIAVGKTVSQIAADLSLSVKTVSTYRTRALGKLNMTTNAEMMRYAMTKGLVD